MTRFRAFRARLAALRLPALPFDAWDALGALAFVALVRGVWLLGALPSGPSAGRGEAWVELVVGGVVFVVYVFHEADLARAAGKQAGE